MSLLFLAANIINSIEMWGTFTCVFSARDHKTNATRMEKGQEKRWKKVSDGH